MKGTSLTRFAWLSIAAAVLTIGLKTTAWWITDSVGLLSDAMESVVNLVGGLMALAMLTVAERPADEDHPYGHGKAEYFSSGVEGTLILIAAVCIGVAAVDRLISPKPLEEIGIGLAVSIVASLVNLGVALLLLRVGRTRNSITLEANARHLLTDVWTSVGVVAGVGMVALTDWERLDPIVALIVAANIIWTGVGIVRRSISGLMDAALPVEERVAIQEVLKRHEQVGVKFHALWTRQAGARKFISLHVLVPGDWTVQRGHQLLERIENDIRHVVPDSTIFTHLESLDDPTSWDDETLDRGLNVAGPKP
jgi:cation diffusion facilitator family transporter